MNQNRRAELSKLIAEEAYVRPDQLVPFARWRYGFRLGLRLGVGFALLQLLYFIATHGQWPSTGSSPRLELAMSDFVALPVTFAVYGLLFPLMRSIRGAVMVGCVIGALSGLLLCVIEGGLRGLHDGRVDLLAMFLTTIFFAPLTLVIREVALVRWRPPRSPAVK